MGYEKRKPCVEWEGRRAVGLGGRERKEGSKIKRRAVSPAEASFFFTIYRYAIDMKKRERERKMKLTHKESSSLCISSVLNSLFSFITQPQSVRFSFLRLIFIYTTFIQAKNTNIRNVGR